MRKKKTMKSIIHDETSLPSYPMLAPPPRSYKIGTPAAGTRRQTTSDQFLMLATMIRKKKRNKASAGI
jgi:hypothetical protein